jgi:hypothetical protein
MKFRFCGGVDAPDWLLVRARLHALLETSPTFPISILYLGTLEMPHSPQGAHRSQLGPSPYPPAVLLTPRLAAGARAMLVGLTPQPRHSAATPHLPRPTFFWGTLKTRQFQGAHR